MKIKYLFAHFLLAGMAYSFSFSQPTLTMANTPQNERTYTFYYINSSNIDHGSSGSNVIWDFQDLNILPDSLNKYYTNNPEFEAFPENGYPPGYFDTTLYNLKSYHYHYLITPERYSIAYELVPVMYSGYEACTVDKTLLEFPFTYEDSSSMIWHCGMINQAYITIHADAWGSLMLPNETYTNTLRVYSYERKEYEWEGTPSSSYDTVFIQRYEWYDENAEVPILSIKYYEKHTFEMGNWWYSYDTTIVVFDHATTAKLPEFDNMISESMEIYPLPGNNKLNIEFSSSFEGEISLNIINILGLGLLKTKKDFMHAGENHFELPVDNIPNGLYILEVRHEKGSTTAKIMVQH